MTTEKSQPEPALFTQNKEQAFFRKQSVTFMILYENEIDHRKSDHAISFF